MVKNWLSERLLSWSRTLGGDGNLARRSKDWWEDALYLDAADTGITVNQAKALTSTAVYACVRVIAETLASLPLITYKRVGDGRKRATDFYLYELLHDSPNKYMTSFEMRETMQGHLVTWGNAFAQLTYDETGRITEIFPLRPDRIVEYKVVNGQRLYEYQLPDGTRKWLPGEIVWHLRAFGGDGMWGYSQIDLARNAIGLALATEKFGSKFFGNGARPGGVLEHPGVLGQDAFDRLRDDWQASHGGLDNAQKVAILEEGMKWHDVGIPPEAAQFLETRKFQVNEIARLFRVPPHMIADLDRATFSNIEHQALEFVNYTMVPWFTRWEQSIKQNLLLPSERKKYYAEFLVDGLLRGDVASRTSYYAMGRQWGWLSANDIRQLENMNAIEGGDEYLTPMNMVPVGEEPEEDEPQTDAGEKNEPQMDADGADNADKTRNIDNARGVESEDLRRAMDDGVIIGGAVEVRARTGASGRFRMASRQKKVFESVAAKILKRERNDVSAKARKMIGSEPLVKFEQWLSEFYDEHAGWSAEQMRPHMEAYAGTVADAVGRELDRDDLEKMIDAFVTQYVDDFGSRESARSYTWLVELIRKNASLAAPELIQALEDKLEAWVDDRSGSIGLEEAVRENNAVAVALYESVGVERLVSIATGESDCPYCSDLDGVIIAITSYFLTGGSDFMPEGASSPLSVSSSKRHAPYHQGCDCMVMSA